MLCIAITGFAADPDAITEALAVAPTLVRRRRTDGARPYSGWWLETYKEPLCNGADHSRGLAALKTVLRGRTDRFRAVAERFKPREMMIYGGLHHAPGERCGLWLDAEDMALIAACSLGWNLDLFVDDLLDAE